MWRAGELGLYGGSTHRPADLHMGRRKLVSIMTGWQGFGGSVCRARVLDCMLAGITGLLESIQRRRDLCFYDVRACMAAKLYMERSKMMLIMTRYIGLLKSTLRV